MIPHVRRITELDPHRRRLHVVGEIHPGELASRGYLLEGDEWVLLLRKPAYADQERDQLFLEFQALRNLGYAFAEGDEWSPAELFRRYRDAGRITGDARFVR
jgi:hypothetical protein